MGSHADAAAIGFMTFLSDHNWDFWLSDVGVLCMRIGKDPAGLHQSVTMAILAVLRLDCERALANVHAERDVVQ